MVSFVVSRQVAFPACPALKLLVGGAGLLNHARYSLQERLGGGTFGQVYLASCQGLPGGVAVKMVTRAATTQKEDRVCAAQEAYALDRCRGHPCIVQLLDTFLEDVPPRRYALVLELWGRDLSDWLRADAALFTPPVLRHCTWGCVQGLAFLHGVGLAHADFKPRNVLGKLNATSGLLDCKIADLGSVLELGARISGQERGDSSSTAPRAALSGRGIAPRTVHGMPRSVAEAVAAPAVVGVPAGVAAPAVVGVAVVVVVVVWR